MKKTIYIAVAILVVNLATAQCNSDYLDRNCFQNKIDSMRIEFGMNKTIPCTIETECLTALSFFPELKNAFIEFKLGSIFATMQSHPSIHSFFSKKNDRKYVIVLQKEGYSKRNFTWYDLSFNAVAGWLGHELAHIAYYHRKTTAGILVMGHNMLLAGYRRKMERYTDKLTINHQLGFALLEGTDYVLHCSDAIKKYKKRIQQYYLSPAEIINFMAAPDRTYTLAGK